MCDCVKKRERGFSLLEMVVAMALGTIVLGAAVQIYSQAVAATFKVSQRAEMQQDFRAASNILTKDLSLAGAGMGNGVAIPLASTVTPVYGCDQTPKCYINNVAQTYPLQGGVPYLYGLIPGYNKGPVLATKTTDVVTIAYTDSTFYLNCYTATVTAKGIVTFAPAASPVPWPTPGCLPSGVTTAQNVNDAVTGLTPGDLVLFSLNGAPVMAEVTGAVTATGTNTYTVPFANSDVLKMNQTPSAGTGLNGAPLNATGTSPTRMLVITYYLDNSVTPARLMRQISGHSPVPVAENLVYMKFSYDLFNDSTSTPAISCPNPGVTGDVCIAGSSTGLLPNQITKINILHMAIDSSVRGAQGGYTGLDLETSVSARNLTYTNEYPN
jgi:prepilin-type N-terminal cleavage/methylation domain-containing protein